MDYGIYYAYWEKEWGGDFLPYIEKVKGLGFDVLEVACGDLPAQPDDTMRQLRAEAEKHGIRLTGGYGPRPEHNIGSADAATVQNALDFYGRLFKKMDLANIRSLGGGLYGYWPVDYAKPFDKPAELARSVANMRTLADMAAEYGITLHMESLNRFEGYLINTAVEAVAYVKAVDRPNVTVMLDTFHMNIEEESLPEAIRTAGPLLGHFHVGEADRKPPHAGGRMPWAEIGAALAEIGYTGDVVMEPFVTMGGQVGHDIRVWREVVADASEAALDKAAGESVAFLRGALGR